MTEAQLMPWLLGALGLLIGSFLNVCISRLPDDFSIVTPRSQCPRCGNEIAWYDNIPLLSFAILGGRCRACKERISWRYPAVELLTGASFLWIGAVYGWSWECAKWCLFAAILIELTFSDLETRILPDEFTKGGIAAGLMLAPVVLMPPGIVSLFASFIAPDGSRQLLSFIEASVAAAALPYGLWLIGRLYLRFRGKEGLGFGDVKMLAMLGAFLGLEATIFAMVIASLGGSILGLTYMKLTGKDFSTYELPLGTFLGAAGLFAGALQIAGASGQ
jgi:leader peptidase (prepilin peptidase)/N-methyltransferase